MLLHDMGITGAWTGVCEARGGRCVLVTGHSFALKSAPVGAAALGAPGAGGSASTLNMSLTSSRISALAIPRRVLTAGLAVASECGGAPEWNEAQRGGAAWRARITVGLRPRLAELAITLRECECSDRDDAETDPNRDAAAVAVCSAGRAAVGAAAMHVTSAAVVLRAVAAIASARWWHRHRRSMAAAAEDLRWLSQAEAEAEQRIG